MDELGRVLLAKTWIGFDLDDTLHEFRRASGVATDAVLGAISGAHGIAHGQLKPEYSRILRAGTANAFADGKTSFQYRRERFASLLAAFSLPASDEDEMAKLLDLYEDSLSAALELKPGATDLLALLKSLGKKIVVVTEGPQDAQDRTVKALGIADHVDFLATTNRFRTAKTDGMFDMVLAHLGVSARDMAYVGDNEKRDTTPAASQGIFSILLDEARETSPASSPPRVSSLQVLHNCILENATVPTA
ncbi:hypothetical protein N3K66_007549 [Trichothecium roseum]|uniref:Uncharacterized protein n=1 Tax=Trichothecium roseum TaxID=47278 RepID=A0ACC0UUA6_9HYPO|nr:hypothetical protein N3K66_007549 [Trichothecium roseum]